MESTAAETNTVAGLTSCPHCGNKLPAGAPYCSRCGRTLSNGDVPAATARVRGWADGQGVEIDELDGLTATHAGGAGDPMWWLNLRASNTEPLLRLNVESRGDAALMRAKTAELLTLMGGEPG